MKMSYSRGIKKEERAGDDGVELRDSDVVCVHGETMILSEHPGNLSYQRLINLNRGVYVHTRDIDEKFQVAESIVAAIYNSGGYFLERENERGIITSLSNERWKNISDGRAIEITLHALAPGRRASQYGGTTPLLSPPVADQATSAVHSESPRIDPARLIKLTPAQAQQMKYMPGCPVWYGIQLNSTAMPSPRTFCSKYSVLGDANMGIVKSISVDILSRNLLYEVSPVLGGGREASNEGERDGLFWEENLCFAPKCPVQLQLNKLMEGEVITCHFFNDCADKRVKKSYMVSACLKDNRIRIFHSVDGDCIKYHPADSESKAGGDRTNTEKNDPKDKVHSEENQQEELTTGHVRGARTEEEGKIMQEGSKRTETVVPLQNYSAGQDIEQGDEFAELPAALASSVAYANLAAPNATRIEGTGTQICNINEISGTSCQNKSSLKPPSPSCSTISGIALQAQAMRGNGPRNALSLESRAGPRWIPPVPKANPPLNLWFSPWRKTAQKTRKWSAGMDSETPAKLARCGDGSAHTGRGMAEAISRTSTLSARIKQPLAASRD